MKRIFMAVSVFVALVLYQDAAIGQNLTLPRVSQKATISQTIGLTDITVSYHRPGVNGREIWGGLVPYDLVWRAGANENTTISFSSPVTVGGRKVDAGTYGLHMIPTKTEWTVILSSQSSAWGSFSYDEAEDAVRITVTPEPIEFQERLSYTFDDPTATQVVVALNWEKLRVPFAIEVDVNDIVFQSIQDQLRGLPRFSWRGWQQAANWCYVNDTNVDQALVWAERSITMTENFTNLQLKAGILEKNGDTETAADLRKRAMSLATEGELNRYGYQLLGSGEVDEAIATFKRNAKDHPKSWNVFDSLAEAYAVKGDNDKAISNYGKALKLADDTQKERIEKAIADLKAKG